MHASSVRVQPGRTSRPLRKAVPGRLMGAATRPLSHVSMMPVKTSLLVVLNFMLTMTSMARSRDRRVH
jgi:hypothetical protein